MAIAVDDPGGIAALTAHARANGTPAQSVDEPARDPGPIVHTDTCQRMLLAAIFTQHHGMDLDRVAEVVAALDLLSVPAGGVALHEAVGTHVREHTVPPKVAAWLLNVLANTGGLHLQAKCWLAPVYAQLRAVAETLTRPGTIGPPPGGGGGRV